MYTSNASFFVIVPFAANLKAIPTSLTAFCALPNSSVPFFNASLIAICASSAAVDAVTYW